MSDFRVLLDKHRSKGILVDTNLLVLYLVGLVNKNRIPQFKRTQGYTVEDFDVLVQVLTACGKLITTPHILTQASDLAKLAGRELDLVRRIFREVVEPMEEVYDESTVLVRGPLFNRFGLTDAAIARVSDRGVLVLTADLELYVALQQRGAASINFNHIRNQVW